MGIRYGFFNSLNGDRVYNAEDFTDIFEGIVTDGVFYDVGDSFYVDFNYSKSSSTNSLVFDVMTGKCMFGGKYFEITSTERVVIEKHTNMLQLLSYICIVYDLENRQCYLDVLRGHPARPAIPPSIPSDGKKYVIIAKVLFDGQVESVADMDKISIEQTVGTDICPWAQVAFSPDRALLAYETDVEAAEPDFGNVISGHEEIMLNSQNVTYFASFDSKININISIHRDQGFSAVSLAFAYMAMSIWHSNGMRYEGCRLDNQNNNLIIQISTTLAYSESNINTLKSYTAAPVIVDYINMPAYN